MDGTFVPTITFGPSLCRDIRKHTKLPIDVHLMTEHPITFIQAFKDAGADIITFHVEADAHIHRTLQAIHEAGLKAGVVLNPATSLSTVENVLKDCDMILLMSVNPGAGGQKFIPQTLQKLRALRAMADEENPALDIEVDGGVNSSTAPLCIAAGANVLVAGNSIFTADDPKAMVGLLRG